MKREKIRFEMNNFAIHWDSEYGIFKKRGWSISWRGHFILEFERFLLVALWKAWRMIPETEAEWWKDV